MAQVALEVQSSAPRDPLLPATAMIDSSFAEALDTVRRNRLHTLSASQMNKLIGSTRGDFPRDCRVVEKAQGLAASLNTTICTLSLSLASGPKCAVKNQLFEFTNLWLRVEALLDNAEILSTFISQAVVDFSLLPPHVDFHHQIRPTAVGVEGCGTRCTSWHANLFFQVTKTSGVRSKRDSRPPKAVIETNSMVRLGICFCREENRRVRNKQRT